MKLSTHRVFVWVMVVVAGLQPAARGADLYVDQRVGKDSFDGSDRVPGADGAGPFRTITAAAKAAQPGDTVHVIPGDTPWRQMADLYGVKGGTPDAPITIDGHGVWLTGGEPCPPEAWQAWKHGVWMRDDLPFSGMMIVEGDIVHALQINQVLEPGEVCYMPNAFNRLFYKTEGKPTPIFEVGQPDGSTVKLDPKAWQNAGINKVVRYNGLKAPTWIKKEGVEVPLVKAKDRLAPGQFALEDKVLYYRPPEGCELEGMEIEAVVRGNGVQFGGATSNVVVRNVNVRYVYNDGYNIHGACRGISFYNCNGEYCADEGFSAHDDCDTLLDGAVYVRCGSGIANVNRCVSVTRNVVIADSNLLGYQAEGETVHTIENLVLIDNPAQLVLGSKQVDADNVLLVRTREGLRSQALNCGGGARLKRLTAVGHTGLIRVDATSRLSLEQSCFAGGQGVIHARTDSPEEVWQAAHAVFGADTVLEWGAKYPWKKLPLQEWLAGVAAPDRFADVQSSDVAGLEALRTGQMPAAVPPTGCSEKLMTRCVDFIRGGRAVPK